MTPVPTAKHQGILLALAVRLSLHAKTAGLGRVHPAPCDVILSSENVVQPDILFVARPRLSIIDPAGGVHGAPDLVVSPLLPDPELPVAAVFAE